MEPVYEALVQVGTFAIGSGIFATLFGGAVKHFLDRAADQQGVRLDAQRDAFKAALAKDAEVHKAALSKDAQVELASLQAALRVDGFRNETRFSRLHDSRAQLIEALYAKLQRAEGAFFSLMSPLQLFSTDQNLSRQEQDAASRDRTQKQVQEAMDAYNDLVRSALPSRIYFEPGTAEQIEALLQQMRSALGDFTLFGPHYADRGTNTEQLGLRIKAWDSLKGEIQRTKRGLEVSFRALLGVE